MHIRQPTHTPIADEQKVIPGSIPLPIKAPVVIPPTISPTSPQLRGEAAPAPLSTHTAFEQEIPQAEIDFFIHAIRNGTGGHKGGIPQ